MRHARLVTILACGTACVALAGCVHGQSVTVGRGEPHASGGHHHGHGPPPHAPAHGYRHKHRHHGHDVELVFDSGVGVYVVVGLPGHYFWDGLYFQVRDGRWYASARLDGGWEPRTRDRLPPGLAKKVAKGKGRKGKKSHPASQDW